MGGAESRRIRWVLVQDIHFGKGELEVEVGEGQAGPFDGEGLVALAAVEEQDLELLDRLAQP